MSGEVSEAPEVPGRAPRVTSLDDFARITARLETGAPREEVLEDEGLTDVEWLGVQQDWLSRMAGLACHGRRQLHERFLERVSALGEADAEAPSNGDDRPRVPEPRIIAARRPIQPRARRPTGAEPRFVSNVPPPVAPPLRPRAGGHTLFETTVEARVEPSPSGAHDGALPFKASASRTRSSLPPGVPSGLPFAPAHDDEQDLAGGTLDDAADPIETLDGSEAWPPTALPFASDARSSLEAKRPATDASWPFPRAERPTTDEHAAGDPYAGLPFTRSEIPAPPSIPPPAGDTYEVPPVSSHEDRVRHLQTQVFADPLRATPTVTLEQYAWLTSLLSRAPEREDETLAWLSLTPERKLAVDAHFAARFQREPGELARYQQLRAHYDAQ